VSRRCRSGVPNHRVRMWVGASPDEPRSSAIGLLLPRSALGLHLPARQGPRPRGGTEGVGTWSWRTPVCNQPVNLLGRQVVEVLVVEPHHRGVLAGAQALDLLVAEETVRGNLL